MSFLLILAVILIAVWGLMNAIAAVGQIRAKEIPMWSALVLLLAALGLLYSAWLAYTSSSQTLTTLLVSLLVVHAVTIFNGYHLYGRFKASHHLGRLVVTLVLLGITYFAL